MWYKLRGNPKNTYFGHTKTEHGRHPDRVLDFWVLGYIHSGIMGLNTGGETASLKAGSFYLLPPDIRHFGTDNKFSDVYWVHFNTSANTTVKPLRVNFNNIILPLFGKIPPEIPFKPVMELLSRLSKQGLSNNEMLGTQLKALLFALSLQTQKDALEQNPGTKAAYELFSFLENNISRNVASDTLEKKFGYCYYELNGMFKKQFGTTIKQKAIELKMNKAFEMLSQGERTASVAAALGFEDYYYFLKLFKKVKHITPKQLKRHYKE